MPVIMTKPASEEFMTVMLRCWLLSSFLKRLKRRYVVNALIDDDRMETMTACWGAVIALVF